MDIEAEICRFRRSLQKEGSCLEKAKQALTSETAKTIGLTVLAVIAVAGGAYAAGRRQGGDAGYSDGWDDGFATGDFAGRASHFGYF